MMPLVVPGGGSLSRRWWAMGALVLAVLAIGLDATVLTLALPTLADSLHASESELQWFVTSYTLALAAAMIPAGLLGDRYGRKKVILVALVVFGIASAACAYSPTPAAFIAARTILGLAGAALIVMSLSVVTVLFDEAERPRAMGVWAAGNFLSMPLGPIVGGWILAHVWWGWVFLMNLPVILIGIVAVATLIPESRSERRPAIDLPGVLASSAGLALLMYSVVEAGDSGWSSSGAIVSGLAGLGTLALFVAWESRLTRRGGEPLVDLGLFRSRAFRWGLVLTAIGIFGMFGVLFTLPQYLQAIQGMDAQAAGFRFLPVIGGLVVGAIPADRVAARFGPRVTVTAGILILVAGMFAGSTMSATSDDAFIAAWTFVVGAGAGVGLATAASVAVAELSAERSGVGAALVQAVIKLGPAFGATILGSVLNSTYQGRVQVAGLPADAARAVEQSVFGGLAVAGQMGSPDLLESVRSAFVAGVDDAVRVAALTALVAAVLAVIFMPGRVLVSQPAQQPAEQPAAPAAGGPEAASSGAAAAPGSTMGA
jgi:DHA2 family multidrug resistance protein-like MFS transporter